MNLQEVIAQLTRRPLKQGTTYSATPEEERDRRREFQTTIAALPAAPPNDIMEALSRVQSGQTSPVPSDLAHVESGINRQAAQHQQAGTQLASQQEALSRSIADIVAQQAQERERQQRILAASGRAPESIAPPQPQAPAPLPPQAPAPAPVARPPPAPIVIAGPPAPTAPVPTPQVPAVNVFADLAAGAPTSRFPLIQPNIGGPPPNVGGQMPAAPIRPGQHNFSGLPGAEVPPNPFGPGGMASMSFDRPPIEDEGPVIGAGYNGQPLNPITGPAGGPTGGPVVPADRFPENSNEGRPGFSADELNRAETARIIGLPANILPGPATAPPPAPMRAAPPAAPIPESVPKTAIQPQTVSGQMGQTMPPHLQEQLVAEALRLTQERKPKPQVAGVR